MQIMATCDFHFGQGDKAEVIYAATKFSPPGTGTMNVEEHARSLIKSGVALPLDHPKIAERIARFNASKEGF